MRVRKSPELNSSDLTGFLSFNLELYEAKTCQVFDRAERLLRSLEPLKD